MNRTSGMTNAPISQRQLLEAFQQDEQFVYALVTREGAIKFGGVRHFLGFRPGGYPDERRIHRALGEHRIFGTREYYYPVPDLLPTINAMRVWMDAPPVTRRDLPRLADCKFHRRIMELEASRNPLPA